MRQTGTGSAVSVGTYIRFTTAYGTPPGIDIGRLGTQARMMAGTLQFKFYIDRVRPGSFRFAGTPQGQVRWIAEGFSG